MTRPYRSIPSDDVLAGLPADRRSRIKARADELIAAELDEAGGSLRIPASGLARTGAEQVSQTIVSKERRVVMSKRELIDTGTDKRYVRRGAAGRFKESDDVGRSLSRDVKQAAKTTVKAGHGDRGDQKKR